MDTRNSGRIAPVEDHHQDVGGIGPNSLEQLVEDSCAHLVELARRHDQKREASKVLRSQISKLMEENQSLKDQNNKLMCENKSLMSMLQNQTGENEDSMACPKPMSAVEPEEDESKRHAGELKATSLHSLKATSSIPTLPKKSFSSTENHESINPNVGRVCPSHAKHVSDLKFGDRNSRVGTFFTKNPWSSVHRKLTYSKFKYGMNSFRKKKIRQIWVPKATVHECNNSFQRRKIRQIWVPKATVHEYKNSFRDRKILQIWVPKTTVHKSNNLHQDSGLLKSDQEVSSDAVKNSKGTTIKEALLSPSHCFISSALSCGAKAKGYCGDLTCFLCNKKGHMAGSCPKRRISMVSGLIRGSYSDGLRFYSLRGSDDARMSERLLRSCLVISVVSGSCLISQIKSILRMWDKEWNWSVRSLGNNKFLANCPNTHKLADIIRVKNIGLRGAKLEFSKWHKDMDTLNTLPVVWIRIRNFPLHYWNWFELAQLASYFGYLNDIDEATMNKTYLIYARIQIVCRNPEAIPNEVVVEFEKRFRVLELEVEKPSTSWEMRKRNREQYQWVRSEAGHVGNATSKDWNINNCSGISHRDGNVKKSSSSGKIHSEKENLQPNNLVEITTKTYDAAKISTITSEKSLSTIFSSKMDCIDKGKRVDTSGVVSIEKNEDIFERLNKEEVIYMEKNGSKEAVMEGSTEYGANS